VIFKSIQLQSPFESSMALVTFRLGLLKAQATKARILLLKKFYFVFLINFFKRKTFLASRKRPKLKLSQLMYKTLKICFRRNSFIHRPLSQTNNEKSTILYQQHIITTIHLNGNHIIIYKLISSPNHSKLIFSFICPQKLISNIEDLHS
jgi:hypothetical protein